MLAYPILVEDDNGGLLVVCPDFPELTTFADTLEEAVARASDALEEAIAARMHDGKDIPAPSQSDLYAAVPTLTAVKVMLYQGMREQSISKPELGRRLGWRLSQVDKVLDIQHQSRMGHMDAALGAIGRQLQVSTTARP